MGESTGQDPLKRLPSVLIALHPPPPIRYLRVRVHIHDRGRSGMEGRERTVLLFVCALPWSRSTRGRDRTRLYTLTVVLPRSSFRAPHWN